MTRVCDCCRHKNIELAPMLKDATWQRLTEKHERLLCAKCVFDRAIDRQVDLTFADLRPCAFNLFHRPDSWFDLFLSAEPIGSGASTEWQEPIALADRMGFRQQARKAS